LRPAKLGLKANAIEWSGGRWVGAADPRSEGVWLSETGATARIARRTRAHGTPPE
jgi:gamma-glutamyltranspeptidase/glutathione hydrolase